jgi:hypothetical protein
MCAMRMPPLITTYMARTQPVYAAKHELGHQHQISSDAHEIDARNFQKRPARFVGGPGSDFGWSRSTSTLSSPLCGGCDHPHQLRGPGGMITAISQW